MKKRRAFSLIELLAVLAIILIVAAFSTAAIQNISRSVELTSSASTVQDLLNLGRQVALSTNCPVEVRFYKVPPRGGAGEPVYRALALYQIGLNGPAQIGKLAYLDGGARLSESQDYGPLLKYTTENRAPLPVLGGGDYTYRSFQYRPDGSTNLDFQTTTSDTWHTMILPSNTTDGTVPKNYVTIQLDPVTGRTELFQPGR